MWEDPIVADVHRIRKELAAKYGFDVKAIFADLRDRQGALGAKLVRKKRIVETLDQRDVSSPGWNGTGK